MRVPPNARQGLYAVRCMVCNRFACLHVLQRRVLYLYVASCVFYLLSYAAMARFAAPSVHCGFALIRPPLALKAMLSIAPPTVDALLQVTDGIDACGAGARY